MATTAHPPPNYINPETRQPEILRVEISLQAAALVVLFLRLYARHYLGQQYRTDDWIIIFANVRLVQWSKDLLRRQSLLLTSGS